ncbi:MAG: hypothetical protein MUE96_02410 [Bacteroidia bacterium]|nr:hypothetical protein [Bacteroidia bacterium]
MKKIAIPILLALILNLESKAQLGTTFYQSPGFLTAGLMYEYNNFVRPEIRIGSTIGSFSSTNVFELLVNIDIVNKADYEFYAGAGLIAAGFNERTGINQAILALSVPVGFNIYPFENKQFGLHIDVSTFVFNETFDFLPRWGIRYKFRK